MRYATPELVEVGSALATVLGGPSGFQPDSCGSDNKTCSQDFELN
jgi:hypothetical protein